MVTETLDEDANVIWGARVSDDMKGKLMIMTIITGVKSSEILGASTPDRHTIAVKQINDDLGIEIVR